ncbi:MULTISPECIES: fimbrial biogenesis chaperone [Burkholderia]|uniref:fimbrial biogenesis chaperone n=1 Tax=Burkholderia TaxID=32008 RepID=UPI0007564CA4|nr:MULTISPECIES: molecular chaperone [Burkholderia]AOJ69111.1 molecular chaperone [Burkholderia savannae]AOJ81106.1 molecular chaperone [Burkholderia savannae]KVG39448.1 molecular chaperone [Burkholderia sp. MSMB0265]KVG80353.1 molecular chaperone [Burkholderia sp. MSMB2040]KVG93274.1 molecular chaperone [Burkholderia sp. MSMB2042]
MKVSRSPGMPARAARMLRRALVGAAAAAALVAPHAHAATSVMIWPIDPVIDSDQRAAALWLENRDRRPVTLQVRVLGWREANGEDVYDESQQRIAGSPPMATVPPGKRQLIRLTRLADAAPGTEEAYRVLIDEIPQPDDDARNAANETALGVKFQMHYSVPLFVYGDGLWTKENPDERRDPATAGRPALRWRIVHDGGKRWLVVSNRGPVHARITRAAFESNGSRADLARGLLGYVLPGAQMRWALPESMKLNSNSKLVATVNGVADLAIDVDGAASNR